MKPNKLFGAFRLGRITVLGSLGRNGPRFNAVASQLTKMAQKLHHDGALAWSVNLSSNWARLSLVILRCCKNIMLNRQAKIALASQTSLLTRNLE